MRGDAGSAAQLSAGSRRRCRRRGQRGTRRAAGQRGAGGLPYGRRQPEGSRSGAFRGRTTQAAVLAGCQRPQWRPPELGSTAVSARPAVVAPRWSSWGRSPPHATSPTPARGRLAGHHAPCVKTVCRRGACPAFVFFCDAFGSLTGVEHDGQDHRDHQREHERPPVEPDTAPPARALAPDEHRPTLPSRSGAQTAHHHRRMATSGPRRHGHALRPSARELAAHGSRSFCNLKTVWLGSGGPESTTSRTVSPHPVPCHRHGKFVATRTQVWRPGIPPAVARSG